MQLLSVSHGSIASNGRCYNDVAADRTKLDDTFEEWETNARRALANLKSQGVAAEPFEVRVADLVRWCSDRNLPIDSAARAEYVSFMLRRKHEGS